MANEDGPILPLQKSSKLVVNLKKETDHSIDMSERTHLLVEISQSNSEAVSTSQPAKRGLLASPIGSNDGSATGGPQKHGKETEMLMRIVNKKYDGKGGKKFKGHRATLQSSAAPEDGVASSGILVTDEQAVTIISDNAKDADDHNGRMTTDLVVSSSVDFQHPGSHYQLDSPMEINFAQGSFEV